VLEGKYDFQELNEVAAIAYRYASTIPQGSALR